MQPARCARSNTAGPLLSQARPSAFGWPHSKPPKKEKKKKKKDTRPVRSFVTLRIRSSADRSPKQMVLGRAPARRCPTATTSPTPLPVWVHMIDGHAQPVARVRAFTSPTTTSPSVPTIPATAAGDRTNPSNSAGAPPPTGVNVTTCNDRPHAGVARGPRHNRTNAVWLRLCAARSP